jgi:hypothetical protein
MMCQSPTKFLSILSLEHENALGNQFTCPLSCFVEPSVFHNPFSDRIEYFSQRWTWKDFIPPTRLHELDFEGIDEDFPPSEDFQGTNEDDEEFPPSGDFKSSDDDYGNVGQSLPNGEFKGSNVCDYVFPPSEDFQGTDEDDEYFPPSEGFQASNEDDEEFP